MKLKHLIEFMESLTSCGMAREMVVHHGYEFAFAMLMADYERAASSLKEPSSTAKHNMMLEAARLLAQATNTEAAS